MIEATPRRLRSITVHDDFHPGDVALLQRVDGGEFVTFAESAITRPVASVTFTGIELDGDWHLTYDLPSGGTRTMPVCRPCFNSEWAAKQRYQLVSEGELVRLDCKECPETLLRVALPTEVAHDAVRDACAEHDRLKHPSDHEGAEDA